MSSLPEAASEHLSASGSESGLDETTLSGGSLGPALAAVIGLVVRREHRGLEMAVLFVNKPRLESLTYGNVQWRFGWPGRRGGLWTYSLCESGLTSPGRYSQVISRHWQFAQVGRAALQRTFRLRQLSHACPLCSRLRFARARSPEAGGGEYDM